MKQICLYFELHQPFRLKRYRFFDIGNDHYYYDDFQNEDIFLRVAEQSYLPANKMMLELLRKHPDFKVAFSISGLAIEQMEYHKPELIDSFRELAETGRAEFLATTYAHSISALYDEVEFRNQVKMHRAKIKAVFGVDAKVFHNPELIYSDEIATLVAAEGIQTIVTEGARHILGWKSPNYLYRAASTGKVKLLLRNAGLSDMIGTNFTRYDSPDYPVTADKFLERIKWLPIGEDVVNIFLNYAVLGIDHPAQCGIFEFFKALPDMAYKYDVSFATPSEIMKKQKPVDQLSVVYPISWSGEEKSTNDWNGNILQQGVIDKYIKWGERIRMSQDRRLLQEWLYLQSSDHLYYMSTSKKNNPYSPYQSSYDAFNNYMNVLSDFLLRVESQFPSSVENEELNALLLTIQNQNNTIEQLQAEISKLKENSKKQ